MNVFGRVWCDQNHKHIVLDTSGHIRFMAFIVVRLSCYISAQVMVFVSTVCARIIDGVQRLPQLPFMPIFYTPTASTRLYLIVYFSTVLWYLFLFIYSV